MSQINPFGGYAAGSSQALRTQSAEKDRQVHRIRRKSQNTALEEDEFEPAINNPDALSPIHDRQDESGQSGKDHPAQDPQPHLDVTG